MIVLAVAIGMAASAATPVAPSRERNALGMCLSKFVHDKLEAKMDAVAFRAAAKTACATQDTAFRNAWVSYDVAMKTRRSEAEESASSQADDYFQNSTDTYVSSTTPAPAHGGAPASPASNVRPASGTTPATNVTPASGTTPPK
jgi:hypothetical protein